MEKKDNNQRRPFFLNNSIRTTIFIYFTVTALAAGLLITFSLYQRLSGQVTAMVQDENQRLIGQVARSVESYLRTIMKLRIPFITERLRMRICRRSRSVLS